jgi:DNA-binding MarR family transcriptional regulator
MKLEEAIKSSRFTDASHKAVVNLMYTTYWMKTHLNTVLKENGLTTEQFNVLRILKGKHPEQMCVKDIGSRMIEKSSNVPRIIDRLLVKKLVKRMPSKEDKRETLISLTDKGQKQVEDSNLVVDALQKKIIGLDENEAVLLNELLEKMRTAD